VVGQATQMLSASSVPCMTIMQRIIIEASVSIMVGDFAKNCPSK